ncbi:hypothetical protein [Brevundimonas sp.]|uniref:hypothetical protein n=1 Tax=Brevundimonas sp. TaxID=1871086 RepID=UPI002D4647BC|nr:hypothetical protein [Brevundimonas sp.]HYC96831.1 hypothetical protein [Brevundimonas sp.]
MRTSDECIAKAKELDGKALQSPKGLLRDGFREVAADWRWLAVVAQVQEKLEAG